MFIRCKFLIAGLSPATNLYQVLKDKFNETCRMRIIDVYEAEVLGPYPNEEGQIYPVVPVTFKIETYDYEPDTTVMIDLFLYVTYLHNEIYSKYGFMTGLEEMFIDDESFAVADVHKLGELPVLEL